MPWQVDVIDHRLFWAIPIHISSRRSANRTACDLCRIDTCKAMSSTTISTSFDSHEVGCNPAIASSKNVERCKHDIFTKGQYIEEETCIHACHVLD